MERERERGAGEWKGIEKREIKGNYTEAKHGGLRRRSMVTYSTWHACHEPYSMSWGERSIAWGMSDFLTVYLTRRYFVCLSYFHCNLYLSIGRARSLIWYVNYIIFAFVFLFVCADFFLWLFIHFVNRSFICVFIYLFIFNEFCLSNWARDDYKYCIR